MTKNNIIDYSLGNYNNYMHSIQMFEKRDHKIGNIEYNNYQRYTCTQNEN